MDNKGHSFLPPKGAKRINCQTYSYVLYLYKQGSEIMNNSWLSFLYASKLIERIKDKERVSHIIEATKGYMKRGSLGAYNDLSNIASGHPMDDVGWSSDEASIIILLWNTFGEVPEN